MNNAHLQKQSPVDAESAIPQEVIACVQRALDEDIGPGDITSELLIRPDATMHGLIIAKQPGVVSGLDIVRLAFQLVDKRVLVEPLVADGQRVTDKQSLGKVWGPARSMLRAERTAMNFLSRMSGIASLTNRFVQAVQGTHAVILDTRKTAPGLRALDKMAVLHGGGMNHRMGLFDMVLVKDNHIDSVGSFSEAIRRTRSAGGGYEIEVEARTLQDVHQALELGIKRILLDNMSVEMLRQAVQVTNGRAVLEASGNVRLDNVREIAETGVQYISVGALTHSLTAFDVSLEFSTGSNSGKETG